MIFVRAVGFDSTMLPFYPGPEKREKRERERERNQL